MRSFPLLCVLLLVLQLAANAHATKLRFARSLSQRSRSLSNHRRPTQPQPQAPPQPQPQAQPQSQPQDTQTQSGGGGQTQGTQKEAADDGQGKLKPLNCRQLTSLAWQASKFAYKLENTVDGADRDAAQKQFMSCTGASDWQGPQLWTKYHPQQGSILVSAGYRLKISGQPYKILMYKGSSSRYDWIGTNARAVAQPLCNTNECRFCAAKAQCTTPAVHLGFNSALGQREADAEKFLNTDPGVPVIFAGHSLGGAMATLAAAKWGQAGDCLITFGQPKAGGTDLANRVAQQLGAGKRPTRKGSWGQGHPDTFATPRQMDQGRGRYLRFANIQDPVPRLPPTLDLDQVRASGALVYVHGGYEYSMECADGLQQGLGTCHDMDWYKKKISMYFTQPIFQPGMQLCGAAAWNASPLKLTAETVSELQKIGAGLQKTLLAGAKGIGNLGRAVSAPLGAAAGPAPTTTPTQPPTPTAPTSQV